MASTIEKNRTTTELLVWTDLSDTGNEPYLETSQIDISSEIACLLNIAMAQDNTAAIGTSAFWIAWGKSGATDDDWNEFARGTYGTIANGVSDFSADGLNAADVTGRVSDVTHLQTRGGKVFLKHGTLSSSIAATLMDFSGVVKVVLMNPPGVDFTNATQLFCPSDGDGVTHWPVRVPDEYWGAKVSFHNPDNDAIYACRVQYNFITDYTSS